MGAGALVASLWLAATSAKLDHFRTVSWSGILAGAFLVATALLPTFSIAIMAIAMVSLALTINGVSGQIVLQLAVPDEMRGRVLSFYTAIFRGTPALGALAIGALADLSDFRWPLAGAGILGILIFSWLMANQHRLSKHLTDVQRGDG